MNLYGSASSSIYLFIKKCLYELPIFTNGQGCVICFQLSKYLKDIWNSNASMGNY